MTLPAPQSMVSPASGTTRPAETSAGSTYLRILGDMMGRFSPNGKMSEVFSKLAEKLKEEEDRAISTSVGALNAGLPVAEPEALPHCTEATPDTQHLAPREVEVNPRTEREAEPMEEGGIRGENARQRKRRRNNGRGCRSGDCRVRQRSE